MNADLFEKLFMVSSNAYMVLDRELRYVTANAAYLEVVATTLEEIVGRRVFDAFPNDPNNPNNANTKLLFDSFQRVLATGEVEHLPMLVYKTPKRTADGIVITERVWSATHTPVRGDDGTVQYVLQHTVDITDLTRSHDVAAASTQAAAGVLRRAEDVQQRNYALAGELRLLRSLFQQAPAFTAFLRGRDHVVEIFNAAYQQLVGHRELTGKRVRDALPEVVAQGFIELLDQVFETKEPFIGRELPIALQAVAGGEVVTRYVDFIYQPIVDTDGEVTGIFVLGNDVTDKTLATVERERLATIVEQSEDFIGTADLSGKLTFMNEAGLTLLGLDAATVATTKAEDVFMPEDLPAVRSTISKALFSTGRWRGDFRMRNFQTGEAIPVDYNVFTLSKAGSTEPSGVASVTRDLRGRNALAHERQFLADAIPSQVWTADQAGLLTWVNRQVTEYFGRTEAQMLADGWQGVVHPEDLEHVIPRWGQSLASGDDYEVEFRLLQAKDATWRWHMSRARAMRDAQGRPMKWYGTNVDIDDSRRTSAERDALISALEGSNKELDRFAYVASHDLKTPLRGIGNLAQWVEDDLHAVLTQESREHLALLRGRVARMDALIDGVLRYSRSMKADEHVQEIDVRDLVDVVVDLLSPGERVKVTMDEQMPVLAASYVALQQVLLNLVGNAVKHCGRPDAHIHVSFVDEDPFYRFTVADNGRGIPSEHRERIWLLFQTLGDSGAGDGIGLSVVKRLVELQGGRVRVDDSALGGAAVSFTWPKQPPHVPGKSGPYAAVKSR